MNDETDPRVAIAGIARQARELLGQVRDSRWPGFDPPRAAPAQARPQPPETSKPQAHPTQRPAVRPGREGTVPPHRPTSTRQSHATDAANAANEPTQEHEEATFAHREAGQPEASQIWTSLEQVAEAIAPCRKCPLHETRTRTVPGEGNPKARLLFVGEAPGADEDRQGRPFVGAAGKLLDQMIRAMGLSRDEVFIANVLKCRPPGNRDPQEHEVAACIPYLRAQIALIGPDAICTLGRHATQALLATAAPIGKLRGHFHDYFGTPVMPTFHPSYLLRSPGEKKTAWGDLQLIMRKLGLPLPQAERMKETET